MDPNTEWLVVDGGFYVVTLSATPFDFLSEAEGISPLLTGLFM
jgi:hypothetical protein